MTLTRALMWSLPIVAAPWVLRRILHLYAKRRGTSSLRRLIPLLSVFCWLLWIASAVFLVLDRHSVQSYLLMCYSGMLLVFSWVKGEAAFEDPNEGLPFSRIVLRVPTDTFVAVRDPANVSDWYVQKLGMR